MAIGSIAKSRSVNSRTSRKRRCQPQSPGLVRGPVLRIGIVASNENRVVLFVPDQACKHSTLDFGNRRIQFVGRIDRILIAAEADDHGGVERIHIEQPIYLALGVLAQLRAFEESCEFGEGNTTSGDYGIVAGRPPKDLVAVALL